MRKECVDVCRRKGVVLPSMLFCVASLRKEGQMVGDVQYHRVLYNHIKIIILISAADSKILDK